MMTCARCGEAAVLWIGPYSMLRSHCGACGAWDCEAPDEPAEEAPDSEIDEPEGKTP